MLATYPRRVLVNLHSVPTRGAFRTRAARPSASPRTHTLSREPQVLY